ncbi:hypothetical protein WISP_107387 [Willisornis vidua]|uniref:Uncharacterized protein n=1 Tax=Willisornis vidua TaxID=1566151 RepID=A0ABQ9D2I6_9PASS|nr:hypothetical protein WISP_107387 [Willisornis vidua]
MRGNREFGCDFTWMPQLFKYDGEYFGNYINHFLQNSDMHLIGFQRVVYAQVLQVVVNLIYTYSGKTDPPVPILLSIHLRSVGKAVTIEN